MIQGSTVSLMTETEDHINDNKKAENLLLYLTIGITHAHVNVNDQTNT